MNQQGTALAGKSALQSRWVKIQAGATLLMLAGMLPYLRGGLDPMAYQVAALVMVPVLVGLLLLWLRPKAGTLWLGAVGLALAALVIASPALGETEPIAEVVATWVVVLSAAAVAGAAMPAFRSLRR